jgi:hypothetical protein
LAQQTGEKRLGEKKEGGNDKFIETKEKKYHFDQRGSSLKYLGRKR